MSQGLVIRLSKLDKMTVSKALKKLVAEGYITRAEHQLDTRAKSVRLTKKGKAMTAKLVPIVEKVDENFFDVLRKTDQHALISMLNNIIINTDSLSE